jgi:hypothetical protein
VFFLCLATIWFKKLSFSKRAEQVLPGMGAVEGEGAQTMYTHVSKCKNGNMKETKEC